MPDSPKEKAVPTIKLVEIMPKAGLVFSEKNNPNEVLCKPKILPLKSVTLVKMEQIMQKQQQQ
jgi:BBSome-interacting protein 1